MRHGLTRTIFRSAEDHVDPEGYEDVASEDELNKSSCSSAARVSVRKFVASSTRNRNFLSRNGHPFLGVKGSSLSLNKSRNLGMGATPQAKLQEAKSAGFIETRLIIAFARHNNNGIASSPALSPEAGEVKIRNQALHIAG